MSSVKLTIIVPVYNIESYIGQCLSSILDTVAEQSTYEVIVINDGSTDQSAAVIESTCSGHDNVRLINQKNQGLSRTRMNGLSLAKGEYIWFVDGDDWLEAGALDYILGMINNSPKDVFITPLLFRFPDSHQDYPDMICDTPLHFTGKDYLQEARFPFGAAPRYIFRLTSIDREMTFFPANLLHEDEYFSRVLLYQMNEVLVLSLPLYNYRQREGSIMQTLSIRTAYDIVAIHEHLMRFLKANVAPSDELWFRQRCFEHLIYSYCLCADLIGTDEFTRFKREKKSYIMQAFQACSKGRNIRKRLMDLLFLQWPELYIKLKPPRYISFS